MQNRQRPESRPLHPTSIIYTRSDVAMLVLLPSGGCKRVRCCCVPSVVCRRRRWSSGRRRYKGSWDRRRSGTHLGGSRCCLGCSLNGSGRFNAGGAQRSRSGLTERSRAIARLVNAMQQRIVHSHHSLLGNEFHYIVSCQLFVPLPCSFVINITGWLVVLRLNVTRATLNHPYL